MQKQLEILKEKIVQDYDNWNSRTEYGDEDTKAERVQEFADKIEIAEGSKYIKIITGSSVWGFIVKTESDKLFKQGDILKAASWAAPARNKPRGNVLEENFSWVRWTGPEYL
jgi:hypothetical protein